MKGWRTGGEGLCTVVVVVVVWSFERQEQALATAVGFSVQTEV